MSWAQIEFLGSRIARAELTGLTQNLGQLQGSYKNFQSNCWVNSRTLGQPCAILLRRRYGPLRDGTFYVRSSEPGASVELVGGEEVVSAEDGSLPGGVFRSGAA